jgi:hypothetical protein
MPDVGDSTVRCGQRFDRAAEIDSPGYLRPLELPGIAERQPVFGIFVLPAILDGLAEQAMVVADAIAVGGDRQRCHAFHETGGEPAKAAIAQSGIRFDLAQLIDINAEAAKRLAYRVGQVQLGHRVEQQAANQELQ